MRPRLPFLGTFRARPAGLTMCAHVGKANFAARTLEVSAVQQKIPVARLGRLISPIGTKGTLVDRRRTSAAGGKADLMFGSGRLGQNGIPGLRRLDRSHGTPKIRSYLVAKAGIPFA
jgi:hypothetical protein